jgi:U2 small nuclear ribonucleoprotein B''
MHYTTIALRSDTIQLTTPYYCFNDKNTCDFAFNTLKIAMASVISQPNNTLYISNIDWKIKKPLLRRAIHSLMTRHGKVLALFLLLIIISVTSCDAGWPAYNIILNCIASHAFLSFPSFVIYTQVIEIIALRRDGLRGQLWVIFEDIQAATAALQSLNGFTFFGKDLKLAYAKEKSDRIAKRDGTYVPKSKRIKRKQEEEKANAAVANIPTSEGTSADEPAADSSDDANKSSIPSVPPQQPAQQPSHILLANDLPLKCNEMMLAMLFQQVRELKTILLKKYGQSSAYIWFGFFALTDILFYRIVQHNATVRRFQGGSYSSQRFGFH